MVREITAENDKADYIYVLHVSLNYMFQRKIWFVASKIPTIFNITEIELWMNGKFHFKHLVKLHLVDASSSWLTHFNDNDSFRWKVILKRGFEK